MSYEDDIGPIPEDYAYFTDCECDHWPEQHGWTGCEAEVLHGSDMLPCPCRGRWEY